MKRTRILIGLAAAVSASIAGRVPSGPAAAGPTQVDAVVTQGALSISAQPTSAELSGAQYNETLPSQATGSFGNVTVSDGRGLSAPWTLTASSTNFVGQSNPASSISLSVANPLSFGAVATPTVGPNVGSGICAVAGGNLVASNTGVAIATGTNALLNLNGFTCTFNPNLTLNVPANTPPQTYRGTVTLTAS